MGSFGVDEEQPEERRRAHNGHRARNRRVHPPRH
jgi:hypothetical protein